jgi:hypothetical protein
MRKRGGRMTSSILGMKVKGKLVKPGKIMTRDKDKGRKRRRKNTSTIGFMKENFGNESNTSNAYKDYHLPQLFNSPPPSLLPPPSFLLPPPSSLLLPPSSSSSPQLYYSLYPINGYLTFILGGGQQVRFSKRTAIDLPYMDIMDPKN